MKFPPLHLGLIPDHLLDEYGHVPVLKDELLHNMHEVLKWTLALRKSGVEKGRVVVSLLPADLQWIIIDTALMRCGAIHVPFHAPHDISLATEYFRNFLFVANDAFRNDPALHGLNVLYTSTLYSAVEGVNPALIQGTAEADVKPGDIATVVFSCDNDSVVKPFAITHENLVVTGHHSRSVLTLNPGEIYLSLLPFSKVYGRSSLLCHILHGCSIHCADHIQLPSRLIKTSKASSVAIVPSLLQYPVKVDKDLSPWINGRSLITIDELPPEALQAVFGQNLKVLICGGSMIPHSLIEKFSLRNVPLMEGYGLTQTTGVFTVNTPS
ncbi:2-succinylbenzoate--CoA ligase [bioreactor metagenome]|uniref:2-succinylbenzoate--CoA ligase n=1 Tax=bioreactor metagenome TaxID=1076179 RepID=A0A644XFZ8_9ZZZZ